MCTFDFKERNMNISRGLGKCGSFNISGTCDPSSGITLHGHFPVVTVKILMDQISHCFTKQDAGILKELKKA